MLSDFNFNKGVDDSAHLLSQYNDKSTFYYQFAHRGQLSVDAVMGAPPDYNEGDEAICVLLQSILIL